MSGRLVITGLGALSCAGANVAEFQQHLLRGACCLKPIKEPHAARLRSRYAGLVDDPRVAQVRAEPGLEGFDRFIHLALVAAREALAAAGVQPATRGRRLGLIFATCSGPMLLIEQHYERLICGDQRLSAQELFAKRYYCGAKVLAHALGVQGFSTTVVTACSASTAAMALAADLIECGLLDAALAGGADAFATSTLAGFEGLKATSEGKCAPFSKPFGLNLGEAAGFVFLEPAAAAAARGASVWAEWLGSGMSNDAFHCSAPDPTGRGVTAALKRALANAGLTTEQITYFNAHGTGTEANDKAETKAIRKVFGPHAERLPVSSTKSTVGHCLGAAGAVETIASILCARAGVFPATANFTEPREGCGLDCVPDPGRPWTGRRIFLSNNSAFGGQNTCVALEASGAPVAPAGSVSDKVIFPVPTRKAPASSEPLYLTACGLVSAAGVGEASLDEAPAGRPGLSEVTLPGLPPLWAGMVNEAEVARFDRRLDLRGLDRSSRWAVVAARAAIREARFPEKPAALAELGFFLHLASGPSWAESEFLTSFLSHNHQVQQVATFPYIVPGSVTGNVCRALLLAGHNLTLCAGPGAGLLGLVPAVAALRAGHAQAILSGAADELSERILVDFCQAGLAGPQGRSPGEGAAFLMLETASHARARGALIWAELAGLAASTETDHAGGPDGSWQVLEATVREALAAAGVSPEEVALLCADVAPSRWEELCAHLCPAWRERRVSVAHRTGQMESAQILADLSAARRQATRHGGAGRILLGIVSSPQGVNCAVVLKTVESPACKR